MFAAISRSAVVACALHVQAQGLPAPSKHADDYIPRSGSVAIIGESGGENGRNPEPLLNRLHWARAWKTDYEIECMRRANARAARGHVAAERAFRDGQSEYEIHLTYLRAADHTEEELPYANIVALGGHHGVQPLALG